MSSITSPGKVMASPSSGIGTTTPTTMTTSHSGSLSPLEQIFSLKAQLSAVSAEKNLLQETLRNIQGEAESDRDSTSPTFTANQNQSAAAYEARLTELHSVIAELKKQLDIRREQIIPEESNTDFEEDFDTEDFLQINTNMDDSLKLSCINSKVAGKGGVLSFGAVTNQNLLDHQRQNQNQHNGVSGGVVLATPSDEDEDELESSSGMMDSSPVNNDNNLPSDIDVDGVYFEDDQIITDEFGLKCVEISNERVDDVINTNRLNSWKDESKPTKQPITTADSNNCNCESLQNSTSRLSNVRNSQILEDELPVMKNRTGSEKSLSFSPLSSPESPEDNNIEQILLSSSLQNPERFSLESLENQDFEKVEQVDKKESSDSDHEVYGGYCGKDKNNWTGLRLFVDEGMLARSFGRKLEQDFPANGSQSSPPMLHNRRPLRRNRKNSNSGRRNRDNNFICPATTGSTETMGNTPTLSTVVPPSTITSTAAHAGKTLEIQNRECHNYAAPVTKEGKPLPITIHAVDHKTSTSSTRKPNGYPLREGNLAMSISPCDGGHHQGIIAMRTTPSDSPSPETKPTIQFASLCYEISKIKEEHEAIKNSLCRKEGELQRNKESLQAIANERDILKNKVSELEHLLKQSPKRLANFSLELSSIPVDESAPICKIAEKVKLHRHPFFSPHHNQHHQKSLSQGKSQSPKGGNDRHYQHHPHPIPSNVNQASNSPSPETHRRTSRHSRSHQRHPSSIHYHNNHHSKNHPVPSSPPFPPPPPKETHCGLTGADLMLIGQSCSSRVVEHLVEPIRNESALRELQHSMSQNSPLNEEKLREFEIETERLNSKIEHLRCQNDVLTLNLEESKSLAERLLFLLGKYESNNVALKLSLGYSDEMVQGYDILVALLESELGQLLANLRATGIGSAKNNGGVTFSGMTTKTASFNSALSSPITNLPLLPSSSSNNAIQKPQSSPINSCNGSGNNNNSNDNSPTGEQFGTSVTTATVMESSLPQKQTYHLPISEEFNAFTSTTSTTSTVIVATTASITTTSQVVPTPYISQEDEEIRALIERANVNRETALNAAAILLSRMDSPGSENNNSIVSHGQSLQPVPLPWEDVSSCSQTLSSASDNSVADNNNESPTQQPGSRQGGDFMNEESRIRDLIIRLKTERESVRQTMTEVDWSLESLYPSKPPSEALEASRKLDIETAILLQELMAMKEEKSELKAHLFLLQKEKESLELRLQSHESGEEAYKARINYLKSELLDYQNSSSDSLTVQKVNQSQQQQSPDGNANSSANGMTGTGPADREQVLKKRTKELAIALEKVTHNSKLREKQNHEMISELKRANGILIETLEAVKRKYQSRIGKMEQQIMKIMERHTMQLKLHKDRIHYLELENKEQRNQQPSD